jgi:hypothetical protein
VRRSPKQAGVEVIERVVRVLAQCGSSREEILEATRAACEQIPERSVKGAREAPMELSDAAHVLTVWFSEPAYLHPAGNPRPLPLGGPPPSLTSLIESVNPSLDAREVVKYLTKVRALKRSGAGYLPRGRTLMLRGARGPAHFRNLRGLLALLRTFGHNNRPRREARGRFEFLVENPNVPKSARPGFDRFFSKVGMGCLFEADGELRRLELTRKPGEPTVRLGVGIFRFEDEESPARAPKRKRARRQGRGASARKKRR